MNLLNFRSPATWIGQHYTFFSTINSTNRWLIEHASHLPHGAVAAADFQSKGQGRLRRGWQSPPGVGLLVSIFLRPNWRAEQSAWGTIIAGIAAGNAMAKVARLSTQLKWPNDLIAPASSPEGGYRKCGGILAEAVWAAEGMEALVIGVGINVNNLANQLPATNPPATSILLESGKKTDRRKLLAAFLIEMEMGWEKAASGVSPVPAWRRRLWTLGKPVAAHGKNGLLAGIAEDVDQWGHLLIRDDAGALHTVSAGEVSLRPNPTSY